MSCESACSSLQNMVCSNNAQDSNIYRLFCMLFDPPTGTSRPQNLQSNIDDYGELLPLMEANRRLNNPVITLQH